VAAVGVQGCARVECKTVDLKETISVFWFMQEQLIYTIIRRGGVPMANASASPLTLSPMLTLPERQHSTVVTFEVGDETRKNPPALLLVIHRR